MHLPGFTAEASIYRNDRSYSLARGARAGAGERGAVTPAEEWYDYVCAPSCTAACLPAAVGGFANWLHCYNECLTFCTGHPHVTDPVYLKA